jgi:putative DNA primase/helicase
VTFPPRTKPDQDGKPRFVIAGDEGPRVRNDEKRRHVYCQGGVPVRIKVMLRDGDAFNVFRVSDGGVRGWQYRKPDGFQDVPYFVGEDPFAGDDGPIYWPEGEKDVETLARLGLPALTFGGTGDGLPDDCAAYAAGRAVVVLSDNDKDGRMHADCKAVASYGVAASVRIVHFPSTAEKGDVSDWIGSGHTTADLAARVEATPYWEMIVAASVWVGSHPNNDSSAAPSLAPAGQAEQGRCRISPEGRRWLGLFRHDHRLEGRGLQRP